MIDLPRAGWVLREQQVPAWEYLENYGQRAALCWHRRYGKDELAMHWAARCMVRRPAVYWHMLPKANQARKAVWDAINPHTGRRRIDEAFPPDLRAVTRENDMLIKLRASGGQSTWQVVGSDNFNALMGAPPAGVVFSEWSLCDPMAWEYLRPALRESNGWAIFLFTPRGRNHGYDLLEMAKRLMKEDGSWFAQVLTVKDTGNEQLADAERKDGMPEEMVQQEYFCSFDAPNRGAYYGREMAQAREENRICRVPYEKGIPVETWWDLGIRDSMAVWLTQTVGKEIRCVAYHEQTDEGLAYYANWLQSWADKHDATFGRHGFPHDIEVRELGTGKSRKEVAESVYGIRPTVVAPNLDLADGIENVRRLLPQCWFDSVECKRGIDALCEYSREWDTVNKVFAQRPEHNWASHGADAFRTMANLHPGRQKYFAESKKRERYQMDSRRKYPGSTWMSR